MAKKSPQAEHSFRQLKLAEDLVKNALEDLKNDRELRESDAWVGIRRAEEVLKAATKSLRRRWLRIHRG